ncbi:PAS domain S-box protein, partial [archaeon]|nr:PAS domain S-box protein [archaeon]
MGEKLRKKIAGPNLGKLAEEKRKLKDVEFNLNAAQKIAHVGSWSLDIEKNILEWSDECYRIFGLKKGTPLSYEKFLKKVYPEDRGIVGEAWKAALKGKRYDIEHRINTKPIKLVRERAKLTFNKKGEPIRGIGTVQDITGGKAAEELTERYKFVIEQSAHQIAFADFNGKIIYVNNSWAVGHGYKKEELIGKPISIFHPKEELKKVKNFNKTLIKTGSCSGEIIHKRKNGTTYPSLMNNFVLKVRGKPAYMIGIAIDITEKKKDEERLANEKNLLDSSMESLPGIFYMFDDKGKF